MTNLQLHSQNGKAAIDQSPRFNHYLKVECYFKDRSKKLFEFERSCDHQMMASESEKFYTECFQHIFSEVDKLKLMMTWPKHYVTLPDGNQVLAQHLLPSLHFGYMAEPCYI
jgi:hypothetical protein